MTNELINERKTSSRVTPDGRPLPPGMVFAVDLEEIAERMWRSWIRLVRAEDLVGCLGV
jgi:hypothetical protein